MATKVKDNQEMSSQQEKAMAAMLAGHNQREAAESAGVTPESVSRWLHGDARFVATLNRRRLELWQEQRDALANLATDALGVVRDLMDNGNDGQRLRAAMCILRAVGLDAAGPPDGCTSPTMIELEMMRM